MQETAQKTDKAKAIGFSGYARHEAIIQAVRIERANRTKAAKLPKASAIVQDAIEELGLRELGPVRFAQVLTEVAA